MASEITYTGPSVREMLSTQTLASNIMLHHHSSSGDNEILDAQEMARLRRFVTDPSQQRGTIMDECHINPEQSTGTGQYHGSLVGFIALRHGGEGGALSEGEIAELRAWFEEQEGKGRNVAGEGEWKYVV
jgi:hypothetical protein